MPRIPVRAAIGAIALVLAAVPSAGQEVSPDIVRAQTGEWLVVPDDGRPGCRIRLEAGRTIGGMVAVPAADCGSRLPKIAEVASWHFAQPGISLNDATRRRVMLFVEDETTLLKTPGDEVPNHMMVQARPGIDRAPFAPAIVGTWTMQRPDGPAICTVTFRTTPPPGGQESFALALDPACDPAVRKLKLASWRIEGFALMLYGTGDESLRFEPAPGGAFVKAYGEGGRPLRLVRSR